MMTPGARFGQWLKRRGAPDRLVFVSYPVVNWCWSLVAVRLPLWWRHGVWLP